MGKGRCMGRQNWLIWQLLKLDVGYIENSGNSSIFVWLCPYWKLKSTALPARPPKKTGAALSSVYLPQMEGFLVRRKPSWNLECQTRSPIYPRRTWYIFLTNNGGFGIHSALSWEWRVSVFALTWCPSAPTRHPSFQRSSALTISWERFERKWKWNS